MSDELDVQGNEFIATYLNLMGDVWHSKEEEARLLADPAAYAREKGLPVAEGATVRLDRSQPDGLLRAEEVVGDWTRIPGTHILHVPAEEIISAGELSDAELEMVSAGSAGSNNNNNVCAFFIL